MTHALALPKEAFTSILRSEQDIIMLRRGQSSECAPAYLGGVLLGTGLVFQVFALRGVGGRGRESRSWP